MLRTARAVEFKTIVSLLMLRPLPLINGIFMTFFGVIAVTVIFTFVVDSDDAPQVDYAAINNHGRS